MSCPVRLFCFTVVQQCVNIQSVVQRCLVFGCLEVCTIILSGSLVQQCVYVCSVVLCVRLVVWKCVMSCTIVLSGRLIQQCVCVQWMVQWCVSCPFSDYRHGATATLHGSPIHHYHLVPAHQQHQMAALTAATAASVGQYGPFSPSVAPPPAHQSPRHVQYTAHPLPAHMHPVLHTSSIPTFPSGQVHPHYAGGASYLNSAAPATAGVYATYQIGPIKARPYQYFA